MEASPKLEWKVEQLGWTYRLVALLVGKRHRLQVPRQAWQQQEERQTCEEPFQRPGQESKGQGCDQ